MLRNSYTGGFPPNFQPQLKGVGSRPPYGPYPHSGPPAQADRLVLIDIICDFGCFSKYSVRVSGNRKNHKILKFICSVQLG